MASSPSLLPPTPSSTASVLASLVPAMGESIFTLPELTTRNVLGSCLALFATGLVLEQMRWRRKKGTLPGRKWAIPIIGNFMDSMDPSMEHYKAGWAMGDMSAASVFHIFIVMVTSNALTRKVFNSQTFAEPCLVASAKQVLLPGNWVFLHGKEHADYRRALNVLFTRRALSVYLPIQERIYKKYFEVWMNDPAPEPKPYMFPIRDLNMETSLRVFCGEYLTYEEEHAISDKYWEITLALQLVNFPLAIPGTKVYNAVQARKIAMVHLTAVASKSKLRMAEGAEVSCLVDAWIKEMIDARLGTGEDQTEEDRKVLVREFSDHEIAMVVLSFLLASQDAMTSAAISTFELLADHPDVLTKVREEQYRIRDNDVDAPLTLEMVDSMTYTRAMVKEALRLLPPVIMVPYMTLKDFPLGPDNYVVPKGTMLIPSTWPSLHDEKIYPEPDTFIPERWLDPNGPAELNPKNYMVWGAGAHKCIGFEYVYIQIAASIGTAAVTMDWTHKITPDTGKLQIIATLFPKDGLHLKFTPRPKPVV